jgi:hypothetical protein
MKMGARPLASAAARGGYKRGLACGSAKPSTAATTASTAPSSNRFIPNNTHFAVGLELRRDRDYASALSFACGTDKTKPDKKKSMEDR